MNDYSDALQIAIERKAKAVKAMEWKVPAWLSNSNFMHTVEGQWIKVDLALRIKIEFFEWDWFGHVQVKAKETPAFVVPVKVCLIAMPNADCFAWDIVDANDKYLPHLDGDDMCLDVPDIPYEIHSLEDLLRLKAAVERGCRGVNLTSLLCGPSRWRQEIWDALPPLLEPIRGAKKVDDISAALFQLGAEVKSDYDNDEWFGEGQGEEED